MVDDDSRPVNYQVLVGWLLLLLGGAGFVWDGWITFNAFTTRSWHETEGMVYSSNIRFATSNLGSPNSGFFTPDVTYRYRIAGTGYTSTSIYYNDLAFLSSESAQKLVDQFPAGRVIRVFYNPDDLQETVLLPGPSPAMWMLFGPAILFLVMGQRILRQKRTR
jgi:hypothetical protein